MEIIENISLRSDWRRYAIPWDKASAEYDGHFHDRSRYCLTVCFFDYTSLIGKIDIDVFGTLDEVCKYIEDFGLEEAFSIFVDRWPDADYYNYSTVAFEISEEVDDGVWKLVAETRLFLPNHI